MEAENNMGARVSNGKKKIVSPTQNVLHPTISLSLRRILSPLSWFRVPNRNTL